VTKVDEAQAPIRPGGIVGDVAGVLHRILIVTHLIAHFRRGHRR
jgi:hypothetical protein